MREEDAGGISWPATTTPHHARTFARTALEPLGDNIVPGYGGTNHPAECDCSVVLVIRLHLQLVVGSRKGCVINGQMTKASNQRPPLYNVPGARYMNDVGLASVWRRRCKTRLPPRELDNQGTVFFFFGAQPRLAIELDHFLQGKT